MPNRIEDYALIGNCETTALVGRDGSMDWLCLPRFDSAACFAGLLGDARHGRWLIAPTDADVQVTRCYRGNTLILETTFETPDGAICVIDFMARRDSVSDVLRLVKGMRGTVAMRTELVVRFDYGSIVPWVSRQDDGRLQFTAGPDRLLLDAPGEAVAELLVRLKRFKLRAAVELADVSAQFQVYATWNGLPPPVPVTAPDPRLDEAGFRALSETVLQTTATAADYAAHRLALGLPDGPPDLEADKTLLLEAGFDELGGVAWDKGCYMGQELTARTKYRGLIKRRLVPVRFSESAPPPGTPVLADGVEVGTLRSCAGLLGLASLRLDALEKPLMADNVQVQPKIPAWMRLPQ